MNANCILRFVVIPAQAGIQIRHCAKHDILTLRVMKELDSRLRGNDGSEYSKFAIKYFILKLILCRTGRGNKFFVRGHHIDALTDSFLHLLTRLCGELLDVSQHPDDSVMRYRPCVYKNIFSF